MINNTMHMQNNLHIYDLGISYLKLFILPKFIRLEYALTLSCDIDFEDRTQKGIMFKMALQNIGHMTDQNYMPECFMEEKNNLNIFFEKRDLYQKDFDINEGIIYWHEFKPASCCFSQILREQKIIMQDCFNSDIFYAPLIDQTKEIITSLNINLASLAYFDEKFTEVSSFLQKEKLKIHLNHQIPIQDLDSIKYKL